MKRAGSLFDEIPTIATLARAANLASLGKRHRLGVNAFLRNFNAEAAEMSRLLRLGSYQFRSYQEFEIRDPKTRIIQAPDFRDRVLHHAMILVTGPVFEKGATDRSYACRAGRGQHAALARLRKWIHRKDWFLKVDVKRFYDSISHEILFGLLKRRFRESRLLDLFAALLDSYEKTPGKGLPIGALTSQYLGNFYLDVVDHHLLENRAGVRGVRYMDDFLILGNSRELKAIESEIRGALGRLGLAPKESVILNRCEQGVPYLGYTIYPDRMRLDASGRRRLRRKLRGLEGQFMEGEIGEQELQDRSGSLFAHASHADDVGWRRMVCRFSRLGEGLETGQSRAARRIVEQFRDELPLGLSQQEQAGQPQQEHRLPPGLVSWHGEAVPSPDVAPSCASGSPGDKTTRESPTAAEMAPDGVQKGADGAAGSLEGNEA